MRTLVCITMFKSQAYPRHISRPHLLTSVMLLYLLYPPLSKARPTGQEKRLCMRRTSRQSSITKPFPFSWRLVPCWSGEKGLYVLDLLFLCSCLQRESKPYDAWGIRKATTSKQIYHNINSVKTRREKQCEFWQWLLSSSKKYGGSSLCRVKMTEENMTNSLSRGQLFSTCNTLRADTI